MVLSLLLVGSHLEVPAALPVRTPANPQRSWAVCPSEGQVERGPAGQIRGHVGALSNDGICPCCSGAAPMSPAQRTGWGRVHPAGLLLRRAPEPYDSPQMGWKMHLLLRDSPSIMDTLQAVDLSSFQTRCTEVLLVPGISHLGAVTKSFLHSDKPVQKYQRFLNFLMGCGVRAAGWAESRLVLREERGCS